VILALGFTVIVALMVAFGIRTWRTRPTAVAEHRLMRQRAECTRALLVPTPASDPVEDLLRALRRQWFDAELRKTAIDALRVAGIGPALQEALRARGITSAADLPRLSGMRVPSLGEKKRSALDQAHSALRQSLRSTAEALSWADCDALSSGLLSQLAAERENLARERAREVEAVEVRRAEIERRLRQLRGL
jgi:DNA-binding helix-hairpin-helix protein with protein kinase domain